MAKHMQEVSPFAKARFSAGYTQDEFGRVAGLSHPTIVRIEKRPWECSWTSLRKYIEALPDDAQKASLAEWAGAVMRKKHERELAVRERELAAAIGID